MRTVILALAALLLVTVSAASASIVIHDGRGGIVAEADGWVLDNESVGNSPTVVHNATLCSQFMARALRRVRARGPRLLKEVLPAGETSISWDGRDAARQRVPVGPCFARIRTPGGVAETKIIIAR
jgi:hypothetical protein